MVLCSGVTCPALNQSARLWSSHWQELSPTKSPNQMIDLIKGLQDKLHEAPLGAAGGGLLCELSPKEEKKE